MNISNHLRSIINYFTKEKMYWSEGEVVHLSYGTLGTSSNYSSSVSSQYPQGYSQCHGFAQLVLSLLTGVDFYITTGVIYPAMRNRFLGQDVYEVYTRGNTSFFPYDLDGNVFKNVDASGFALKVGDLVRLPAMSASLPEHTAIVSAVIQSGGKRKIRVFQNLGSYGIIESVFNSPTYDVNATSTVTVDEDVLLNNCTFVARIKDSFLNNMSTAVYTLAMPDGSSKTIEEVPGSRIFNLPDVNDYNGNPVVWKTASGEVVKNGDALVSSAEITADVAKVTLSFNSNGGSAVASRQYNKGQAIGDLPTPTRTGYKFDGWYHNAPCTAPVLPTFIITANKTVYAKWTQLHFVSYYLNGGSCASVLLSTYVENSFSVTWSVPTRPGYFFKGWKYGSSYCYPGNNIDISADTTLTAQWKPVTAVITFDMSSIGEETTTQTLTYGDGGIEIVDGEYKINTGSIAYPQPERPTIWYEKYPSPDSDYSQSATYIKLRNFTVYPVLYRQPTPRVRYFSAPSSEFYTQYVYLDEKAYVPNDTPTKEGYCFLGWGLSPSNTVVKYYPGQEIDLSEGYIELYALWTNEGIVLRYISEEPADGIPDSEIISPSGTGVWVTGYAPSRDGYTFKGWSVNDSRVVGNKYDVTDGIMFSNNTSTPDRTVPLIFTAIWERVYNIISVRLQSPDQMNYMDITCTQGEKYGNDSVFEEGYLRHPDGYYFDYFQYNDKIICPNTIVEEGENHTLTLRWYYPMDEYKTKWFGEYMTLAKSYGLMDGTMAGENATRAQVITVLHRLAGSPAAGTNPFYDVRSGYANEPVSWAYGMGIAKGGSGLFMPNDNITRTGMALFVYRFCRALDFDMTLTDSDTLNAFTDTADIAALNAESKKAFRWCVKHGIIEGTGSKLEPNGSLTRAQLSKIAVVLHKMFVYDLRIK